MDYSFDSLSKTIQSQIQLPLPIPLNSKSTILVICACGTLTTINYRAFLRKWKDKDQYLCKSCHVKTYASDPEKLEKYRASFKKISETLEYKEKCRESGKKAWLNSETRIKLIKAITKDNLENPKKKLARQIALEALKQKPWFLAHMAKIRERAGAEHRSTTAEFIQKAALVHNGHYDYTDVSYLNRDSNVVIICPNHGPFLQTPHNHLYGKGCRHCSNAITKPHRLVIDMIPTRLDIELNNREAIAPKEIDIWLPEYRIGIEINGEYWHGIRSGMINHEMVNRKYLHQNKANISLNANVRLYQFWVDEIIRKPDIVQSIILNSIGMSKKLYARQCQIISLKNTEMKSFFDLTHLQGHRNASINYALITDDGIMCGLSLSRHKKHQWEIIRYANRLRTIVIGGFSRLLHEFVKTNAPTEIVTFADRRISVGHVYIKNGFEFVGVTSPNYFYSKSNVILSRQQCQKHKLPRLLKESFNDKLTEVKNMLEAGYTQNFDAGHCKFIKKFKEIGDR